MILSSLPNISWENIKPQTANIQLPIIFVLIIIWKVKGGEPEMYAQG